MSSKSHFIAVIGLGYVGLPLALGLARHYKTTGFDVDAQRITELKSGHDRTREADAGTLAASPLAYTHSLADIAPANVYIVTVPTPVDHDNNPDLTALRTASQAVGSVLCKGDIVVYESTVYPGVTEEECGPILAQASGLIQGKDFFLGYSPERINPGDKEHRIETIIKVVAADSDEALTTLCEVYGAVVSAGIHRAPSIKVAEAAKVIENTQRDINIALMNELAVIFDKMGIRTADVLAAARTKWNFLPFSPGLVGGHCIGVDPYYLTTKAKRLGYHPQVVLAGRQINDTMGAFIAQKTIKMLALADRPIRTARVGVLGLTFKENVPDIRNSRVPDILKELYSFGIDAHVYDPYADADHAHEEYAIALAGQENELYQLDALIIAVAHTEFRDGTIDTIVSKMPVGSVIIDVKSVLAPDAYPQHHYWSL